MSASANEWSKVLCSQDIGGILLYGGICNIWEEGEKLVAVPEMAYGVSHVFNIYGGQEEYPGEDGLAARASGLDVTQALF